MAQCSCLIYNLPWVRIQPTLQVSLRSSTAEQSALNRYMKVRFFLGRHMYCAICKKKMNMKYNEAFVGKVYHFECAKKQVQEAWAKTPSTQMVRVPPAKR